MKKEDIGGYVFLAISILIYIIFGGWDFALWVAELVNYDSDDYSLWEKLSYNWSLYDIKFYFILFVGVLCPIILIFIGLLLLQGFLENIHYKIKKKFRKN